MTIPTTTRAAVLTEHGAPLTLTELPLPEHIEPGAALVRITCTTLCGTDIEIWAGKMTFPGMLPMVLGHEMVGEVIALGDGAVDALGAPLQLGDRIGWSESVCGECFGCTVLRQPVACAKRGYGFLQRSDVFPYATAGLSEYAYVTPGAQKLRLPAEVKDTWASAAGCAAKTVLRAFDRAGGVRPGSRVVVQGSGALGLFATAVASISGAGTVITAGAPAARLELAQRFGATHTIDIAGGSNATVARVLELTDGQGADLVLDFAGAPSIGPEAVGMAAQRGTVAIVGSTGPTGDAFPLSAVMGKELTVVGSLNGDVSDYYRSIEFFRTFADRFPWDDLFSAPCGLDEASDRIANMHELREVKAVIDPRLSRE
ncbi:zinc-binding dehydrogenase [Leucobacter luti]|uniref:D-arabinose 1-dehydrogenase-like Zn-dependent alcohol dehydrogenase n=1 Tax=Leucobacter luti TaxID=340320 RepID=A0A4Q7U507_9MICO|nr:zinc-binding dehydrogenase [Leucobacter luti]MBL3701018.1 alcohol dehydrogenase [Leucobacter luti]RZT68761.1 D-arabinose 1-dehydrogenase-like Zn-dependent alcohol dehydrogenase [Leucobacter luti]